MQDDVQALNELSNFAIKRVHWHDLQIASGNVQESVQACLEE
jgi:hypothetical protein